jgi:hypothetical protein
MNKLAHLIKEVREERQSIIEIEELLGRSLTEAELEELDLKRAAKKARNFLGAAAIAASTMGSAKAAPPVDSATTTVKPVLNIPKWEGKRYITVKKMDEWNKFVDWLKKTKVEDLVNDIETEYKGSGILAGNEIMNHEDYSDIVLEVYKDKFPETSLTKTDIPNIQAQVGDLRNQTINKHHTNPGSVKFNFPVAADYSNYMRASSKSGEDGIVGKFTSQIKFPREYMMYFINDKKVNTADLGYATNIKEHKMTKQQLREIIRHLIKKTLEENQPKPATNPNGPATLPTTKPKIRPTAPGKPSKPGNVPDDEPAKARGLKKENESARAKIIKRLINKM